MRGIRGGLIKRRKDRFGQENGKRKHTRRGMATQVAAWYTNQIGIQGRCLASGAEMLFQPTRHIIIKTWPLLGDVISWQVVEQSENCLFAFAPNNSAVPLALAKYEENLELNYQDYVWQENEYAKYIRKFDPLFFEFGQNFPVRIR